MSNLKQIKKMKKFKLLKRENYIKSDVKHVTVNCECEVSYFLLKNMGKLDFAYKRPDMVFDVDCFVFNRIKESIKRGYKIKEITVSAKMYYVSRNTCTLRIIVNNGMFDIHDDYEFNLQNKWEYTKQQNLFLNSIVKVIETHYYQ